MALNVLSYGGGVQSTAILILAAQGLIKLDAAIYVELDAENPETIQYVREFAEPFAIRAGIEFIRINVSLVKMIEESPHFPAVPFRDRTGKMFGRRQCTVQGKIRPFRRALRALLRRKGEKKANVLYGISYDELFRMRDSDVSYITNVYPLITMKMDRQKCKDVIAGELPIPPKSACWFCPFASARHQRHTMRNNPHLVAQAARLQDLIDDARQRAGLDYLVVVRYDESQKDMFEEQCGGTCHT